MEAGPRPGDGVGVPAGAPIGGPSAMLASMSEPAPPFRPEPWTAAVVPPAPPDGDLSFTCPRCRRDVEERAYGPCTACRAEMRSTVAGERRDVAEADYVPKMNVTPNAVAVKE